MRCISSENLLTECCALDLLSDKQGVWVSVPRSREHDRRALERTSLSLVQRVRVLLADRAGHSIQKVLKAIQVVQRQLAQGLRLQQSQRLLQGPRLHSVRACQYVFVEYIGSSGAAITADDIARFPKPPSNVKLSWVVAFVADAGPSAAPTGEFVCTSGSLCSGSKLDSVLLSSLKSVAGAEVYAGLGGPLYPSWPTTSAPGYAATAAQSLIAFAKANLLAGYDLNFQAGLNDDWVKQWTSIVGTLTAAGLVTTINPSVSSKEAYIKLTSALGAQLSRLCQATKQLGPSEWYQPGQQADKKLAAFLQQRSGM
ncbi:TPA: hypothetical protein ACH3X3_005153 [Trebouxia sp. C0006]